jgi:hypothetical protein
MNEKDYQGAVKIIQATNTIEGEYQILVDAFVEFFKADNPKFNEDKFRKACDNNKEYFTPADFDCEDGDCIRCPHYDCYYNDNPNGDRRAITFFGR